MVKNPPANAGQAGSLSGLGGSPGEGNGKPTSVFLPGKPHGQRSVVGYSPWDRKRVKYDLVTNQQQTTTIFFHIICGNELRKKEKYLFPRERQLCINILTLKKKKAQP